LRKEATVKCPIEHVFHAWTTSEGMASWWAKDSWIDLRIGGPWELYFIGDNPRGWQGSEGCRILSYCPPEMLSYSWNFPPEIPTLRFNYSCWIVIRFAAIGPSETRVVVQHLGWKEGPDWDAGWRYFDKAWDEVLERLVQKLPGTLPP
jgi:uncharacterized protein YndB with AHSA1/START domain